MYEYLAVNNIFICKDKKKDRGKHEWRWNFL